MSNHAWVTGADVLKDLQEVNGRNMGPAHLEQFVVRGEMPPPARRELHDDEEMQYHFGADAAAGEANYTPDLQGISMMLKMVDDLDDPSDCAEPQTIFRNTETDEICISKLNPNVNEFVPCGGKFKLESKSEASKQMLKAKPKFDTNGPVLNRKSDKMNRNETSLQQNGHSSTSTNVTQLLDKKTAQLNDHAENSDIITLDSLKKNTSTINNIPNGMDKETSCSDFTSAPSKNSLASTGEFCLPKAKPKFDTNGPLLIRKSNKMNQSERNLHQNGHSSTSTNLTRLSDEKTAQLNDLAENSDIITVDSLKKNTSTINNIPNGMDKETSCSDFTSAQSKTSLASTGEISLDKKLDITRMKSDEIAVMKEKVKSKIINPSHDNAMQRKREKNVAIATLLKLCTASPVPRAEEPIKLVTPQYFQGPPKPVDVDTKIETVKDVDISLVSEKIEQIPDTSTNTKVNQKFVDPLVEESISKVNNWLYNTGSPKPQPPAALPVFVKPVAFKKKSTSTLSITTTKNEASSQKKESCGNFVPSSYANDLLQKYENNAKKMVGPKEDLGTMLERKLKERDQHIKSKLLEKKNAASPDSGRSVQ